jgi:hypothetical protein
MVDSGIKAVGEVGLKLEAFNKHNTDLAYVICHIITDESSAGKRKKEIVQIKEVRELKEFEGDAEVRAQCDDKVVPPSFTALRETLLEMKHGYAAYKLAWKKGERDIETNVLIKFLDEYSPAKMKYTSTFNAFKKSCQAISINIELNGSDELTYKHILDDVKTKKN